MPSITREEGATPLTFVAPPYERAWDRKIIPGVKSLGCFLLLIAILASGCDVVKVKRPEEPVVMRSKPFNVGFEEGKAGDRVPGWRENPRGEYRIELVDDVKRSGGKSALIRALRGENADASLNQDYAGAAFAGKTVRVRAWIKVEDTEVCDVCNKPNLDETALSEAPRKGAQVRVLGYTPNDIASETLITPLVMGTKDWTLFEASTAMPANLENAIIAPILWGKGKAWFDDIEVLVE